MRAARVWRLTSLSVSVVQAILRGENISAAPRRSRACNYRPNTKVSHRLLSSVGLMFDFRARANRSDGPRGVPLPRTTQVGDCQQ